MSQGEIPDREEVRKALLSFARLLQRLDEEGELLRTLPYLVGRLGDLRHLLFEYEVRFTERLLPVEDPQERESRRIVREARDRDRNAPEEWGRGWTPEEDGTEEEDDDEPGDEDDGNGSV